MVRKSLRGVASLVGLAALVTLVACTPTDRPDPATAPSTEVTAPPRPDFCEVALPPAWRDAIRAGRITVWEGERTQVIAAAPDGSVFANVQRHDVGTRLVWLQDGGRRVVATMPDPFSFALRGSFDGRWLVYALADVGRAAPHGRGGVDVYAWDSTRNDPPSLLVKDSGPALDAVVRDGRAAWTRHISGGEFEVHLYSLTDRRDRVIARGRVSEVQFVGDHLQWLDRSDGRLRAVSATTGESVPPPAMPAAAGALQLATDGLTTAWVSDDQQELTVWRPDWPQPLRVLRIPRSSPGPDRSPADAFSIVDTPAVARDLVVFRREHAWYAADLRTGGYARLTEDHGYAVTGPGVVALGSISGDERTDAILSLERLPPLPRCRA